MASALKDNALSYDGKLGPLYGLWFSNFVLGIFTLGIYRFWGKTKLRKYIVGSFTLSGDRFEYAGKGKELFLGFLKALPIILPVFGPILFLDPKQFWWVSLLYIPAYFLILVGLYASLRYRYSRTKWRGIRFALIGSAMEYASLKCLNSIINFFTLGIIIPYRDSKLADYMWSNTYFGNTKAIFNAQPSKLMKVHIITLLLMIPTIGLSRLWYRAAFTRYVMDCVSFKDIKLKGLHTAGRLYRLTVGNVLIYIITLGLGAPIALNRTFKFIANNVIILGDLNTSAIMQSGERLSRTGEGLESMIGDGVDVGVF